METLDKLRQGDSSDYELLRHQLADPDIKVKYSLLLWELDVCVRVCVCAWRCSQWTFSPLTGRSDHQLAAGVSWLYDAADQGP